MGREQQKARPVARRVVAGLAGVGVFLSGCSSDDDPAMWEKPETTSGTFTLSTHCGIHYIVIHGELWETKPLDDGNGNPPRGWGNPGETGTMEVLSADRAVFTSEGHKPLIFHPSNDTPAGCA